MPLKVDPYLEILSKYSGRYPMLGEGRNRIVFQLDDNWVIKIPLSLKGDLDNSWEASCYHSWSEQERSTYAYCETLIEGGITLLKMELLVPVQSFEGLPDWVSYIDCQQVGHDRKGNLKAYDWGCQ